MKNEVIDSLVDILDNYYFPEGRARSMYAVLGPVNIIIKELRKLKEPQDSKLEAISGKAYRYIEQANPKGVSVEAAKEILNAVKELAKDAPLKNRRELKNYLEDLRYAVYLRQMISKFEYWNKKKKKEKEEE